MLGAGGFIGTNLCRALAGVGVRVVGFGGAATVPPALAALALPTFSWRGGRIETLADPDALVAGCTHVFDLIGAGLPDSSNRNPAQTVADALPPKVRLLEACRRQRVRRLVFASSGGTVYGPAGPDPIAETAATDPISAYGIGKLTVEKYLGLYRHLYGFDGRVLRIANAYGPHQHPLREQGLVASVLHRLLAGSAIPVWGDGAVVRDYIHVHDVVSAMLTVAFAEEARPALYAEEAGPALYAEEAGPALYNVGSGVGRSVLSVIEDAARVVGRAAVLDIRPGRSADVAVNILDSTRLRRQTGWQPEIGWEDGLAATAAWLQRSG